MPNEWIKCNWGRQLAKSKTAYVQAGSLNLYELNKSPIISFKHTDKKFSLLRNVNKVSLAWDMTDSGIKQKWALPLNHHSAVYDLPGFEKSSMPALQLFINRKLTLVSGVGMQEARLNRDAEEDTGLPFKCHKFSNIFVAVQPVVNLGHFLHHGPAMLP